MELVLNFDEKQVAINEDCSLRELEKKLKTLLGDDYKNWTIAGREVKWVHQYWPTIIYNDKYKLDWVTVSGTTTELKYGDTSMYESIVCFSDNPEYAE
jgi:hypothetical protein